MKTIKMQVTYKELCWMLEGLDEMIHRYKDHNIEIEKVRAHVIRKMLVLEREAKNDRGPYQIIFTEEADNE